MGHVFLRGQIHQKLFGRSPPDQDSATRFYRYRRATNPSSFFKSLLRLKIAFLRNIRLDDVRRAWLQHKSQRLGPSLKVVQDPLLVAIFII